ncbi:MAG: ABC transporter permease, partial [Lachnospiraceae bacterium]|nr:ABC transporter permease [Lachnospiraceae bacterium]
FLFLLFTVTGMAVFTAVALLIGSLSFWFVRMDMLENQAVMGMVSFATYPDGIFQGISRFLLYFIIPVGMAVWHPVHIISGFDAGMLVTVLGYAGLLSAVAAAVFYRGLRRYASGSLMEARL